MPARHAAATPSALARAVDRIIRVLLALAFVSAGGLKLAGAPQFVAMFEQIGLGQWFRLFTGALELFGGLLILIPHTARHAAALLAVVMVGALATHAFVIGGNPSPAAVLLALAAGVLWLRRPPIKFQQQRMPA